MLLCVYIVFIECQIIHNAILVIPKREISILVNFVECCFERPLQLNGCIVNKFPWTIEVYRGIKMHNFGFLFQQKYNKKKNKIIEDRDTDKSMPIPVPLIECSCINILINKVDKQKFWQNICNG